MRKSASALVALIAGIGAAASALAATASAQSPVPGWLACEYTVTVIEPPDLTPGIEQVVFLDVNDQLTAVGFLDLGLQGTFPIRWSEEEGVVILPSPPGHAGGTARRINNNGSILVWSSGQGAQVVSFVYLSQGDGSYEIVPLPPQHQQGSIYARDINDQNEVVGAFQFLPRGASSYKWAGFRWAADGQGLQWYQVPGWSATELWSINNHGVIAGNVSPGNAASGPIHGLRAFVDADRNVTIIEPEAPWTRSYMWFVNDVGMLAGGVSKPLNADGPAAARAAVVMPGATAPTVIEPPAGWSNFQVSGLNNAGLVAGVAHGIGSADNAPAVMVGGQVVPLSDFVDAPGPLVFHVQTLADDGSVSVAWNTKMVMFRPVGRGADLTCDDAVGADDLGILLNCWQTSAPLADLNGDGIVDGADLGILLNSWSPRPPFR